VNVELLLYALVATISPLGLAATLAVIAGGRLKSLVFALGFVFGQLAACLLVVLLGASFLPHRDRHTLRGALEVALGVVLISLAVRLRRRPMQTGVPSVARSEQLLARLRRLSIPTAVVGGLMLGIGGPKRLLLTVLAGTSIAASEGNGPEAAALVVGYTLVATLLVWAPVLAFALAGDRVTAKLGAARRSLAAHERAIGFYSILAVGAGALAHGLSLLT
jgi:cytochrome c biogenesis protein CcdA